MLSMRLPVAYLTHTKGERSRLFASLQLQWKDRSRRCRRDGPINLEFEHFPTNAVTTIPLRDFEARGKNDREPRHFTAERHASAA